MSVYLQNSVIIYTKLSKLRHMKRKLDISDNNGFVIFLFLLTKFKTRKKNEIQHDDKITRAKNQRNPFLPHHAWQCLQDLAEFRS